MICFFNIYIFIIINKKRQFFVKNHDFFVTTQTTKFMKFVKYNIDSQLFKNVGILNI